MRGKSAKVAATERRDLTPLDVEQVVFEGALLRVRPKVMTVATIFAGLIPIMYGHGTGSEIMQRIAAPMVGGMATATLLTLLVIPAIFVIWKRFALNRVNHELAAGSHGTPQPAPCGAGRMIARTHIPNPKKETAMHKTLTLISGLI